MRIIKKNNRDTCTYIDFAHEKYLKEINANWNDIVPHILDYNFTIPQKELNKVSQIIRQTYMGDKQLTMDNFYDFVKVNYSHQTILIKQ